MRCLHENLFLRRPLRLLPEALRILRQTQAPAGGGCDEWRTADKVSVVVRTREIKKGDGLVLKVPVYKLKDKNVVVKDKNFLNATEQDFEKEEWALFITVSQIKEWAEKIRNTEKAQQK